MQFVSKGAGMIAGLELWRQKGKFLLVDTSPDKRFAVDVDQWTAAVSTEAAGTVKVAKARANVNAQGINTPPLKKHKDATK